MTEPSHQSVRPPLATAARLALVAVIAWALVHLVGSLDLAAVGAVLAEASAPLVLAAVAAIALQLWARALGWRLMLSPIADVPSGRMFRYHLSAFAASTLFPGRAGDLLRLHLLRRHEGVSAVSALSVTVVEKAYEALSLVAFLAPLPWLLPGVPGWVGQATLALGLGGAVTLTVALALARATGPGRTLLARVARGAAAVRRPGLLAAGLGILIVQWLLDFIAAACLLRAVGLDAVPLAATVLLVFVVTLAILVPVVPAHIGTFDVATLFVLGLFGAPAPEAAAFTLLYHAVHVIPMTLLGLPGLRLVTAARRSVAAELADPPSRRAA